MSEQTQKQMILLKSKNNTEACGAMKLLAEESENTDELYKYMDEFIQMTQSDNSYVRTRGLTLICANAKWDRDNKIDENIDMILTHIMDIKPITSRKFIERLPQLAAAKPELHDCIVAALHKADVSRYAESMQGLVYNDIRKALDKI